jgi:hypothetical protein
LSRCLSMIVGNRSIWGCLSSNQHWDILVSLSLVIARNQD